MPTIFINQIGDPETSTQKILLAKNDISIRYCTGAFATYGTAISNHMLFAELKIEDVKGSGEFRTIIRQQLKVDDSGCDTWNIEKIVRDQLTCDCPLFGSKEVFAHTESFKKFKICFLETFDLGGSPFQPIRKEFEYTILNAGVNEKFLSVENYRNTFLDKILSWFPGKQNLTTHQHHWLTVLSTGGTLRAVYELKLTDGTTITQQGDPYPTEECCMYSFPAGLCQIFEDLPHPELIDSYCVKILGLELQVLDEREFCVICHESHFNYFLVCNSRAGFDTFHFTGKKQAISSFEGDVINLDRILKKRKIKITNKVIQNTGFVLHKCDMWFYCEFFGSEMIKQIRFCQHNPLADDNCECCTNSKKGFYCDVIIPSGDFAMIVDFEHTPFRQFEYYETEKQIVSTPMFCLGGTGALDPCEGLTPKLNFELELDADGKICITAEAPSAQGQIYYSENGSTLTAGNSVCTEVLSINPSITHGPGTNFDWRVELNANPSHNNTSSVWHRDLSASCTTTPDFDSYTWNLFPSTGSDIGSSSDSTSNCDAYRQVICDNGNPDCCFTIYYLFQSGPSNEFDSFVVEGEPCYSRRWFSLITDCGSAFYYLDIKSVDTYRIYSSSGILICAFEDGIKLPAN